MNRFARWTRPFVAAVVGTVFVAACAPTYTTEITSTAAVPGLEVAIEDAGGMAWQVVAKNQSGQPAKLLWDDSAYVYTTGESSRLVRGKTRVIDSGRSQPPSPIPAGATLREFFLDEDAAGHGTSFGHKRPSVEGKPARIVLVFEVGGSRQTYEASVAFLRRGE